jgi:hypothetical protein
VDFGFFSSRIEPIAHSDVISVTVGGGLLSGWLGVGWVELRTKGQTLRMSGVRHPEAFAERIRKAIAASKKA